VRLVSFSTAGVPEPRLGILTHDGVLPTAYTGLLEAIAAGSAAILTPLPGAEPVADYRLHAPLRPGKILCSGINYPSHLDENPGAVLPTEPFVFAKLPTAVVGPGEPIRLPEPDSQVDYEVELAVVIGSHARRLSREAALGAVFGYTLCNDVSARDVQFTDNQITLGKGYDTFAPLGPCVVTADEVGDPQDLRLWCTVNGEPRQATSTAEMLFPVAVLLEYVSRHVTLEPGDIVTTGTPAGVAAFRDPPPYLRPGDLTEIGADRIGVLRNPVEAGWDDSTASGRW
jgi:2-keto-4-pentenoate hydratase/2-oxohepta-3-ene-1,7-dioic acid hydratase in catechol pathway